MELAADLQGKPAMNSYVDTIHLWALWARRNWSLRMRRAIDATLTRGILVVGVCPAVQYLGGRSFPGSKAQPRSRSKANRASWVGESCRHLAKGEITRLGSNQNAWVTDIYAHSSQRVAAGMRLMQIDPAKQQARRTFPNRGTGL